jgi:photosystem II stability/assembly factor-like uncharacterized protein
VPDLDSELAAERARFLDGIDQPSFEPIAQRAGKIRRRRTLAQVGAAAMALAAIGAVSVRTLDVHRPTPPPPAASPDATGPAAVYSANGITINGLPDLPNDLPGDIADVEFVDAERGYLLTKQCSDPLCAMYVARTLDGGRTWSARPAPGELAHAAPTALPQLILLGELVTLTSTGIRYVSDDGAQTWKPEQLTPRSPTVLPGTARLQLELPDSCGGKVEAWLPVGGLVPVIKQPDLSVCWTSPVRAGDGSWWVGGFKDAAAAVAVSRDGGQNWATTRFDVPGSIRARVATLGTHVYVTVLGPDDALQAIYSSGDNGQNFTQYLPTGKPLSIRGDLVPLLDGRLLLVDREGGWYVTRDNGVTWVNAQGLHQTARLERTVAGYVAYNMTKIYTAFSVDGSTWRKINAR